MQNFSLVILYLQIAFIVCCLCPISTPRRYHGNTLCSSLTYSAGCSGPFSWQIEPCHLSTAAFRGESLGGFCCRITSQSEKLSFMFAPPAASSFGHLCTWHAIEGTCKKTHALTHTVTHWCISNQVEKYLEVPGKQRV